MILDKNPSWIDNTSIFSEDLFRKFFAVINCPVGEKSARAIVLPEKAIL